MQDTHEGVLSEALHTACADGDLWGVRHPRAAGLVMKPSFACENAERAVQGQVPTLGYPPPEVPTSLGTQPPGYLGR